MSEEYCSKCGGEGVPPPKYVYSADGKIVALTNPLDRLKYEADQKQNEQTESSGLSFNDAIKWIEKRAGEYLVQHSYIDPDTGAVEFGTGRHAQAKREYVSELEEIIEGLRALARTHAADGKKMGNRSCQGTADTCPNECSSPCQPQAAQQQAEPTTGEEIQVNVSGGDVYTLPLQASGMDKPRFVVHVPRQQQDEPKCKSCGGNNADMPCAYPEGGQPHCLKQAEPVAEIRHRNGHPYAAMRKAYDANGNTLAEGTLLYPGAQQDEPGADERAAFEHAAQRWGFDLSVCNGVYTESKTHHAWCMWQVAAQSDHKNAQNNAVLDRIAGAIQDAFKRTVAGQKPRLADICFNDGLKLALNIVRAEFKSQEINDAMCKEKK